MAAFKNIQIPGPSGRPILTDVFFDPQASRQPAIIYAHGFNGFKDWGGIDTLAQAAAGAGFVFIKFNFSHNGTTPDAPEEFADLNAYAENNYTKELDDLKAIIDWTCSGNEFAVHIDSARIGLIGHSRGGGIVLIKAAEDLRVKAVATWASVSECKTPWGSWPEAKMQAWEERGVQYITNSRTKQELPLHYQLYEDYVANASKLDVCAAIARLTIQALICHGTEDNSVPVSAAYALKEAQPAATLFTLPTDHIFGRRHPWTEPKQPALMMAVWNRTMDFFRTALGEGE